jgi:hypothetical protein
MLVLVLELVLVTQVLALVLVLAVRGLVLVLVVVLKVLATSLLARLATYRYAPMREGVERD